MSHLPFPIPSLREVDLELMNTDATLTYRFYSKRISSLITHSTGPRLGSELTFIRRGD